MAFDCAEILAEGIRSGQIGGNIDAQCEHALDFAAFGGGAEAFSGHVADLGSGVGLPALVLALSFDDTSWTLIERRSGRTDLLRRAVRRLGLSDRVEVVADDAAIVGWSEHRSRADFVTARSFGPPALTAEVAAPLLRPGGSLLTSEPRGGSVAARWPEDALVRMGLELVEVWDTSTGRFVRLQRTDSDIPDLPRQVARKRPLF